MANKLKQKVGEGGISPKLLEHAQERLDYKVEQQADSWMHTCVEDLKAAYSTLQSTPEGTLKDFKVLTCAAVDLRSTALALKDDFLAEAARSLHLFSEIADPADPRAEALVDVHMQAIFRLLDLDENDLKVRRLAEQIVGELKTAAQKIVSG